MEAMKKKYIACTVIIVACIIIVLISVSFSEKNAAFQKIGDIVLIIGMAVTSMGLYFINDSTVKMIFKSLIYMAILGLLTLLFREKLAELNLFIAFAVSL